MHLSHCIFFCQIQGKDITELHSCSHVCIHVSEESSLVLLLFTEHIMNHFCIHNQYTLTKRESPHKCPAQIIILAKISCVSK